MMSRMKLLGFSFGSSFIPLSVTQAPRRFLQSEGARARATTRGPSAARVVVDGEPERAGGRIVFEVVTGALKPGRRSQKTDHGGLVRRELALLGLIVPHEPLYRGQGGLICGELRARERAVLLQLLDRLRGRGEVA